VDDARLELLRLKGRQFDPDVVDAFARALEEISRAGTAGAVPSPENAGAKQPAAHRAGR
jgi:HD-GYP domain-containing protein (c-di-GMP phosphodiesterase class II)